MLWDANGRHNRYGYGPEAGFHIWKTDDQPRLMGEDQVMHIGMTVEKGQFVCSQQVNEFPVFGTNKKFHT